MSNSKVWFNTDSEHGEAATRRATPLPSGHIEKLLPLINSLPLTYNSEDGSMSTSIINLGDHGVPLFEADDLRYVSTEAIAIALKEDYHYGFASDYEEFDDDLGWTPQRYAKYRDDNVTLKNAFANICSFMLTCGPNGNDRHNDWNPGAYGTNSNQNFTYNESLSLIHI